MPYDVTNMNSVMDAWNQSAFDKTRQTEAENNIADRVQAAAQQSGLLNDVANRTGSLAAVAPSAAAQPAPATATQMAAQGLQGTRRRPTTDEYAAFVINYLGDKGYGYDDAAELMRPSIEAYRLQERADNRNRADALAAQLDQVPINSPEYRAGAYRLAQLDPTLGKLYMSDMVSRKDEYNQNRALAMQAAARQQKREDAIWNANQQNRNYIQRRQMQDAYERQRMQDRYNWLVNNGYDKQTAMALVVGNRGGTSRSANASSNNSGLLSSANLKIIENEYNKMLEQVQDGTLPVSDRGRFMYYGRFLKQNADRLAGYNGQVNNNIGATLQDMFDNQVKQHGYSDDLARAFKDAAAQNGVNLTDNDIKTLTAKYRKA